MKNVISILVLVITFGCNENRKNNNFQSKNDVVDSIEESTNLHEEIFPNILSIRSYGSDRSQERSNLIKSINIRNTNYQLYENLSCLDTLNHAWTTKSLSIVKNGILKNEFFKEYLLLDGDYPEAYNSIVVSTISSDQEKSLIQINFDCAPCAPGDHTIALIQFQEHSIKKSKVNSIRGEFIIKNGVINGIGWQGYFAYELPYKLTEEKDKLEIEVDTSKILYKNDFYFLKIKDAISSTPKFCEIEMTIDPFGEKPSATTNLTLKPNTKVTLIYMAVKKISPSNTLPGDWIKIKVSDQEGWIKNSNDLTRMGFFAAG